MSLDFRPLLIVLLAVGALAWFLLFRGEVELTDENVTSLIDDTDQAFRKGNSVGNCAQRAKDFTLYATTWNLMPYREPSSFAEIEYLESNYEHARNSRHDSYSHTYSRKEFCEHLENQADESRETFRRRTELTISVDTDGKHADYEAEYVLVAPLPEGHEYPKGATGDIFIYSRLSESGTVTLEDHKAVIKSSRNKLRKYWIYPTNIPEIDRPVG